MSNPRGRGKRTSPPPNETPQGSSLDKAAQQANPPAGIVGDAGATQAGEDVRRRGWFWHWNSVVTQYAPLLGLKGVGLLNSYTVWTDRREESPHRGYAFPSQQREADFYGEDRAELITINKILVALDLIEIRKEMVLRTDPQGRRWRVPHNFYRVKDHHDGFTLSTAEVLKVVELADRDKAVYRYVRRLFSPRFAPIDSDNVWHRIMPELRENETWQGLSARAEREESKASARTKAGHAARKANLTEVLKADSDTIVATPSATTNDSRNDSADTPSPTSVATTNRGSGLEVDSANTGSDLDVASANTGLDPISSTTVDPANDATPTGVDPTNTTYNQLRSTTTTTTRAEQKTENDDAATVLGDPGSTDVETLTRDVAETSSPAVITGGRAAPFDAPGEEAATRAFEDANARRSTPAERQLLAGLAAQFDEVASAAGSTGWQWVKAATYEAVESGSAFVAPRRLREILTRWERDGAGDGKTGRRQDGKREGGQAGRREGGQNESATGSSPSRHNPYAPSTENFSPSRRPGMSSSSSPPGRLAAWPPHSADAERTWAFALGLLAESIDRERLAALVAGVAISGYRDGEVTLAVPDPVRAEQIASTYSDLIARKLGEAMRRPVRLAVITTASDEPEESSPERTGSDTPANRHAPERAEQEQAPPSEDIQAQDFIVPECGVPNRQVWAAILAELATRGDISRGDISRANLDTWLRPAALIGRGDNGALIIGASTTLAQRRLTTRFLPDLEAAIATITGTHLPVEIVLTPAWLRDHPDQGLPSANQPSAEASNSA